MSANAKDLKLFGIFGHPLQHTLSPAFQEAGFAKSGILAHYLVFDFSLPVFKRVMRKISKTPLKGFNVTVPYKQAVIPYLDWVTDSARAIGAVNTVYRFGKKWYGTNTDAEGFWLSLKEKWNWKAKGKSVLVFGAGGAARAVVYALASHGVKIVAIYNRTEKHAQEVIATFSKRFPKTTFFSVPLIDLKPFDLVVNTTSVGLKRQDKLFLNARNIPSASRNKKYFVDLIYNPEETPFLKLARKKGHFVLSGLPMLLYQGARAFEIWTGRKAPIETMRSALEQVIRSKK